ncbi:MAG: hypothetical protein AAF587_27005 [Bacteroidota bacterium]
MKRKQVPQLINQGWFPKHLKQLMFEFMSWFVSKVHAAKPFMPVIEQGLQHTSNHHLINIDRKMGAGIETLIPHLPESVTVENIPLSEMQTEEEGLYTMINSFHQFAPAEARTFLSQIARKKHPLAILEGNNDSLWQLVGMTIILPMTILLTAPIVRPFRPSRLLFTYLIPILPIASLLDGFLALFKLYAPKDLDQLVSTIQVPGYMWESGKRDNGRGGKIMYLLGYPVS